MVRATFAQRARRHARRTVAAGLGTLTLAAVGAAAAPPVSAMTASASASSDAPICAPLACQTLSAGIDQWGLFGAPFPVGSVAGGSGVVVQYSRFRTVQCLLPFAWDVHVETKPVAVSFTCLALVLNPIDGLLAVNAGFRIQAPTATTPGTIAYSSCGPDGICDWVQVPSHNARVDLRP